MVPDFQSNGLLPAGIHKANWEEFCKKFGFTAHRRKLLNGLEMAAHELKSAGCMRIFVNGSFVTSKEHPNDYDVCWDMTEVDLEMLDSVFLNFSNRRAAQKQKYFGEAIT